MCGIVGIIDKGRKTLADDIIRMRDTFIYRGPDGAGYWCSPENVVGLGHRRLSILDLSDAGAQPMHDATGQLTIVHNGEVYNYRELRIELEQVGYSFRSETDTEVILAAYERWGTDCLTHFNGMFAFAIWDARQDALFIARDRLGIKPLYYHLQGSCFLFASEIKAILAVLPERPRVDTALIDSYMDFGYIPGKNTLFQGIQRLLPGCFLVFRQGMLKCTRYWDFQFHASDNIDELAYLDQCRALLNDSIDLRLRSDVPLGIFLSGGLDSSAIVALLAPRVSERLKTFSVAYDFGSEFNETAYARLVAKKYQTDHHEFIIQPSQFCNFIPKYVWYMDEPVTESAAISLYFIAKLAKDYVTVVLSGEGSDELFAGYDFYFYNLMIERYRTYVGLRLATALGKTAAQHLPEGKWRKYLRLSAMPLEERYKGISTYDDVIKDALYNREFSFSLRAPVIDEFLADLFDHTVGGDALSRMLYFDTRTWLVDDLLIKADRMSMAASLELRVPFLDYRMVEFAAGMPSRYKIRGRTNKHILKKLMQGELPPEIIHRKKLGFPTPLKTMFESELSDYACDLLLSPRSRQRGYFRPDVVERVLFEHRRKTHDHHRLIWQLVVLEEWHRRFVD